MFAAEFFAEKNNNYLLNQELQALKAEFAKKDKSSQEDKISSQEEMDWSQGDKNQHGNDNAEIENDKQLEDLARMKQSGLNRVGPQFQSVEKSQMIKCTQCDLEFDSELNLKKT